MVLLMETRYQECPLCNRRLEYIEACPHYVCNDCIRKATDEKGEKVVFFHGHFTPIGLQGYKRRNTELIPFEGNTCYIRGVKCFATFDPSHGVLIMPAYDAFTQEDLKFIPAFKNKEQPA
jgi:hypothetical protein